MSAALEIRGAATGLLDDPLWLRLRGGARDQEVLWRARHRDDNERVWRATAAQAHELAGVWELAKGGEPQLAALQSLRPVSVDVRAETSDGRAVNRTFTRALLGEGVRARRWRDGLRATLYLPAAERPCATLAIDATGGPEQAALATLAAALLASRGVLALVAAPTGARKSPPEALALAVERLALVPRASASIEVIAASDPFEPLAGSESGDRLPLPPGVAARGAPDGVAARADAWDRLLARLGALPREQADRAERTVGHPGTVRT